MLDRLRDYQRPHAERLLSLSRQNQAILDLSDQGTGKTFCACYVLKQLATASLVVCPKIVQTQWREAAAHFDDAHSIIGYEKLRAGNTDFGWWERARSPRTEREFFVCKVCQCRVVMDSDPQWCPYHPEGIHCVELRVKSANRGRFNFHPNIETVVFDEIQRCTGLDSENADMLVAAKRQGIRILGLSATVGNSPLHFRALGYALDFHNLETDLLIPTGPLKLMRVAKPSWDRWSRKRGVRFDKFTRGLRWYVGEDKQQEIMRSIREQIIPARGARICKADLPNFPKVDIQAELYDLEEADKIQKIYEQMADALAVVDEKSTGSVLIDLLRERERVELLKIPIVVELAQDYIDQGVSIGIFVNFRATIAELAKRTGSDCIVDGWHLKERQNSINRFQLNDSKLILVNSECGGVGLTLSDIHGGHPRGGLVFPGLKADTLRQVFGRFPRDGAQSPSFYKVILAAGTCESDIHRNLRRRMNNLDALNDNDLYPDNLRLSVTKNS